jgi:hypothetical protein
MCSGDFNEVYGCKNTDGIRNKFSKSEKYDKNILLEKKNTKKGDKVDIGKNKDGNNSKNSDSCEEIGFEKEVEIEYKDENEEQWDAVVTCFFVDTAPVVIG